MSVTVRVARVDGADPTLPLPDYATAGAAGADLCADTGGAVVTLAPGARALVHTGLRVAVPEGYEMQIRPRSGLALKHGITLANAPGTVDSDYRGPLGVILVNLGAKPFDVTHGMRIAQAVVAPVVRTRFALAADLDGTARGSGGFGSTGVDSATPESTAPESTAPESTALGSTAPGSTAPGSTAPESTALGSTAPGSATPGSTAPGSITLLSTTPGSTGA